MPFDADDLAAMVDDDMPSHAVATIGGVEVVGRFRRPPSDALGMSGFKPAFRAAAALLSGVGSGDSITIGGVSYTVSTKQDLDAGESRLDLDVA